MQILRVCGESRDFLNGRIPELLKLNLFLIGRTMQFIRMLEACYENVKLF